MTSIAFLGLGTMGLGMARQLAEAGHRLTVYNRTRSVAEDLAAALDGGTPGGAQIEVVDEPVFAARRAEVVIVCVANDAATRAVMLGEGGALAGLGEAALVLDCGTSGLGLTAELAAACELEGADFLGAPITGSKLGAEGGQLTFMVGGSNAAVARAEPLFSVMGRHVVHVGEDPGDGQRAKYCLNMTQAVMLEGILEGYTLARLLGIAPAKLAEVFEHSAGRSGVGSFKTPYLFAGDYTPHFRLDLMHKDLHLALGEAKARRVPLPAATRVRELYDQAVAEGLGGDDFLALAKLLERWAGVQLRGA